jgi:hypothetical protein
LLFLETMLLLLLLLLYCSVCHRQALHHEQPFAVPITTMMLLLLHCTHWHCQALHDKQLGMCVIVANTMERCSLFLPLRWGAGPMALMLWLNLVI